jgi:Ca2+/Na+ antiporter
MILGENMGLKTHDIDIAFTLFIISISILLLWGGIIPMWAAIVGCIFAGLWLMYCPFYQGSKEKQNKPDLKQTY